MSMTRNSGHLIGHLYAFQASKAPSGNSISFLEVLCPHNHRFKSSHFDDCEHLKPGLPLTPLKHQSND